MSRRTPVGGEGERFYKKIRGDDGNPTGVYIAAVWVRDRDGKRRLVQARAKGKQAANRALERRLQTRRPLGKNGVEPNMTVQDLGVYWMARRRGESKVPIKGQSRGRRGGPVAAQTLAAHQAALTHIINPNLGGLRLYEVTVGIVDEVLREIEIDGRSTGHARTTLGQMFALAVRHDAMTFNPMGDVERPRRGKGEVHHLTVDQARQLLAATHAHANGHAVDTKGRPTGGRRRTPDVHELVIFLLATGCRIGEALAVTWLDIDLSGDKPTVHVAASMVEPRRDKATGQTLVETLHRQPLTKGGGERTLIIPEAAVRMLTARRKRTMWRRGDDPVFANRHGGHLWPNNQRTKLRRIIEGTAFEGVTPHTLRRTVGTLISHEAGQETARDVLGHSDSSVTFQHYVAAREIAPDVRYLYDRFFTPDGPADAAAETS